jgi:hypothetical protein
VCVRRGSSVESCTTTYAHPQTCLVRRGGCQGETQTSSALGAPRDTTTNNNTLLSPIFSFRFVSCGWVLR